MLSSIQKIDEEKLFSSSIRKSFSKVQDPRVKDNQKYRIDVNAFKTRVLS